MRKLFAMLLVAGTALANETSYRSLQSGSQFGGTPLYDHGLHGEGQIVAVLDTGLDINHCYFAEEDGSAPPINTGTPGGGYQWQNVNPARRKVIAYDFLYSCDQFPNAPGCDNPSDPNDYDNQGHGTHAAASIAADRLPAISHDYEDALATGAKLVIQDAGFIGGDACSQRPGIGCPVALTPILDQAYKQGARIHSNSWGDRQGAPNNVNPPTANYSQSARDVDAFVYSHPDMLILFNTGNGSSFSPPASSLSAPGCAKNTLQVGGTRTQVRGDDILAGFSLLGPTRDGRIKPDVVGPAWVYAADAKVVTGGECSITQQGGTSWSSPSIAGAAALVRQYYTDGFYPTGVGTPSNRFTPSAALMKATIIAAAHRVPSLQTATNEVPSLPVPSFQQGFGFPSLDDALFFPGDARKLRVADVATADGIAQDGSTTLRFNVRAGTAFKAVLVWTDPPGVVRGVNDPTPELVNDLDLRVVTPSNATLYGNGAQPDRLNNVEAVSVDAPEAGTYTVTISGARIGQGPRQGYSLVVTGDLDDAPQSSRHRAVRH